MRLGDHIVPAMLRLTSLLPLTTARKLGRAIGRAIAKRDVRVTRITRTNIDACYPALSQQSRDELVTSSLEHTAMLACELGPVWLKPVDWVLSTIESVEGKHYLDAANKSGKGVILCCPHLGNWEVFGYWAAAQCPIMAMYAPPKSEALSNMIKGAREKSGSTLVPTDRSGVIAQLKCLRRGETIGILPDQQPQEGSGIFAPFMGRPTYTMTLVNTMVAKTNATVLMVTALRTEQGFKIVIQPYESPNDENDIEAAVTAMNEGVENLIALAPEQYQWEYKRFRKTPEGTPFY